VRPSTCWLHTCCPMSFQCFRFLLREMTTAEEQHVPVSYKRIWQVGWRQLVG
jgi:hypothetical protein